MSQPMGVVCSMSYIQPSEITEEGGGGWLFPCNLARSYRPENELNIELSTR